MAAQTSKTDQPHAAEPNRDEKIPVSAKLVMAFFVLVFLGFGLVLIGECLSALWR